MSEYEPYDGDQPLAGPDMPPMKTIMDLIRYCITVHSRFGNTCIEIGAFKWGACALNARDQTTRSRILDTVDETMKGLEDCGAADSIHTTEHCKTAVPEHEPGEKLLTSDTAGEEQTFKHKPWCRFLQNPTLVGSICDCGYPVEQGHET